MPFSMNVAVIQRIRLFILSIAIVTMSTKVTNAIEIKLPSTSEYSVRDDFNIGLLELLLKKIPGEHKITTSLTLYSQSRLVVELQKGDSINLYWMGTSPELEHALIPIYFPIYRGLLGQRILIIHKKDKDKFSKITSLSELQKYQGIQSIGWTDIKILEYSGLQQYQAMYEETFKMLEHGRVDYFSRGVNEAFMEVEERKHTLPNLIIDENILLVYPFAMYFFTNPKNEKLATSLTEAFKKAYEDGSFLEYFYNHPEMIKTLKQMNINKRFRIDIPNPFLTEETAGLPAKYWH